MTSNDRQITSLNNRILELENETTTTGANLEAAFREVERERSARVAAEEHTQEIENKLEATRHEFEREHSVRITVEEHTQEIENKLDLNKNGITQNLTTLNDRLNKIISTNSLKE